MYGPTGWHVAFLLINFYQIYHLIQERKRLQLPDKHAEIASVFESLTDQELIDSLTRSTVADQDEVELVVEHNDVELSREEKAFRDIAFNRLSRGELLNLLVRRLHSSHQSS